MENSSKVKKIAAIVAVILLVLMYVVLFVLAIVDSSQAMRYFVTAFFCTMVIPIMLWFFLMMYRNKHPEERSQEQQPEDQSPEQHMESSEDIG